MRLPSVDRRRRDALLAHLYDSSHCAIEEDGHVYHGFAELTRGPALELGCGSGRVLASISGAGVGVVGVDKSPSMLRRARSRLINCTAPVSLIQGDVRDPQIMRSRIGPYGLVALARSMLGYMRDSEQAIELLRGVGFSLAREGLVIVDQVNLSFAMEEARKHPAFEPEVWDPMLEASVRRSATVAASFVNETMVVVDSYVIKWANSRTVHIVDSAHMRCYREATMASLLRAAGLAVRGVYGDYQLAPYHEDSERMLFLAGRAQ